MNRTRRSRHPYRIAWPPPRVPFGYALAATYYVPKRPDPGDWRPSEPVVHFLIRNLELPPERRADWHWQIRPIENPHPAHGPSDGHRLQLHDAIMRYRAAGERPGEAVRLAACYEHDRFRERNHVRRYRSLRTSFFGVDEAHAAAAASRRRNWFKLLAGRARELLEQAQERAAEDRRQRRRFAVEEFGRDTSEDHFRQPLVRAEDIRVDRRLALAVAGICDPPAPRTVTTTRPLWRAVDFVAQLDKDEGRVREMEKKLRGRWISFPVTERRRRSDEAWFENGRLVFRPIPLHDTAVAARSLTEWQRFWSARGAFPPGPRPCDRGCVPESPAGCHFHCAYCDERCSGSVGAIFPTPTWVMEPVCEKPECNAKHNARMEEEHAGRMAGRSPGDLPLVQWAAKLVQRKARRAATRRGGQ